MSGASSSVAAWFALLEPARVELLPARPMIGASARSSSAGTVTRQGYCRDAP